MTSWTKLINLVSKPVANITTEELVHSNTNKMKDLWLLAKLNLQRTSSWTKKATT